MRASKSRYPFRTGFICPEIRQLSSLFVSYLAVVRLHGALEYFGLTGCSSCFVTVTEGRTATRIPALKSRRFQRIAVSLPGHVTVQDSTTMTTMWRSAVGIAMSAIWILPLLTAPEAVHCDPRAPVLGCCAHPLSDTTSSSGNAQKMHLVACSFMLLALVEQWI